MENSKHSRFKRILAIIGIVLLVGMYIVTLVASIIRSPYSDGLFMASLYCTFVIPVLIFAAERIVSFLSGRNRKDS